MAIKARGFHMLAVVSSPQAANTLRLKELQWFKVVPSGTPNLYRNLRAAEIFLGTKKHKLERISFDHKHGCTRVDLFLTESTRARRPYRVRIESS